MKDENEDDDGNVTTFAKEHIETKKIKSKVNEELNKRKLYKKINELKESNNNIDEKDILNYIESTGLIDQILEDLNTPKITKTDYFDYSLGEMTILNKVNKQIKDSTTLNKLCLILELENGTNFIDFLAANSSKNITFSSNISANSYFIFDINFLGQRRVSDPIQANSDFNIEQAFAFNLNPNNLEMDLSYSNFLKTNEPIHIVLILFEGNKRKVISVKSVEWRWCLAYGYVKINLPFKSIAPNNKNELGNISVIMSINPVNRMKLCSEKIIKEQIRQEKEIEIDKNREFIHYSSEWWEEYKSINTNLFSHRIIKLFLQSEDKDNYVYKPFCSIVHPISSRRLNTPYEALRYVSLIPYEKNETLTGEKIEMWCTLHTFLSIGKGDVEDHVQLLCNLLLGFGLDAYIACGISKNGQHCWVITRDYNRNNNDIENKNNEEEEEENYNDFHNDDGSKVNNDTNKVFVTFWESLNGQRIGNDNINICKFYKNIHCVFNDKCFYGNIQENDNPFYTNYDFDNNNKWKKLNNKDIIDKIPKYLSEPLLEVVNIDISKEEIGIENMIKLKIDNLRKIKNLNTVFDNKLSNLLGPSLVNYEMEKITNCLSYNNEEFKDFIKNYIPKGCRFSAFPFHLSDITESSIIGKIVNNDLGSQIIYTTGDQISFGIRIKLYSYPQGIYSLWGVIGVKYREINN